jgi:hypothetical protein
MPQSTLETISLNTDSNTLISTTWVNRFEVAGLTLPSQQLISIQFVFQASSASGSFVITNAYVGHGTGTNNYAFAATPTQLLFSGSAGVTISQGTSVTTDMCFFQYDKTDALLVAYYAVSASFCRCVVSGTNISYYYKAGSDAATVAKTGYASAVGDLGINQIIGYTPNGIARLLMAA